jgi:hypothetical protein
MNELVQVIVKKTGISQMMAMTVVNIVIDYLKNKLPAPIGNQIVDLLNNCAEVQMAENLFGGLVSNAESTAGGSKKKGG